MECTRSELYSLFGSVFHQRLKLVAPVVEAVPVPPVYTGLASEPN